MVRLPIIHVDMDAFYAAIEIRDNPALRGKPVIVGGSNPQARGVVSAASYKAREFGIRSAMPLQEAFRRCPEGVFLPVRMNKYVTVSKELMKIFKKYTPLVEPLSLDEAFLDISGCGSLYGNSIEIGKVIKKAILNGLGLTASVGIAANKFLAKLASDLDKPNGFVVIGPDDLQKVVHPLSVEKLWGVGKKTADVLKKHGLNTIGQIAALDPCFLQARLGTLGKRIWELAQGIDHRIVETDTEAKSVGREYTFGEDISDISYLKGTLLYLAEDVGFRLREMGIKGKTISIKLRYADFETLTRCKTLSEPINLGNQIYRHCIDLLASLKLQNRYFRLIGVAASGLTDMKTKQLPLFVRDQDEKNEQVALVVDSLKEKFGRQIITPARFLELKKKGLSL